MTSAAAPPTRRKGTRRRFVARLAGSLAAAFSAIFAAHLAWLYGAVRFLRANVSNESSRRVVVPVPRDFPPGSVDAQPVERHHFWLVHANYRGRGQIYALRAVCTHLGCTPIWVEAQRVFRCPCHGSNFRFSGENLDGPAPRPLERLAVRALGKGQIEVDAGRTFRDELGEWTHPDSFVAADEILSTEGS